MKSIKVLLLVLCLLALVPQLVAAQENTSNNRFRKNEGAIPNSYIVVFNEDVPARRVAAFASQLSRAHGGTVGYTYENALRGFSVEMSEAQAVALSRSPQVAYVAEDVLVEGVSVQTNPTWALDRIDQRNLPLDAAYNYANNGTGVNAYIIDGGIRYTHQEFGGRAASAYDYAGGAGIDCNGHGTHVAGIIGGNTYGVAKGAKLWSVRVLDCANQGPVTQIIAGIDWLMANHVKPAVANMSFASGTANDPLDLAVRNLIAAGVTTVVAAGNNNGDAGLRSPARVREAITVAATDQNDTKTSLSNFGAVVDVFAPGAAITSAHSTDDSAISTRTGTSSAAPFVAGLAARYLGTRPGDAPEAVSQALTNGATAGKVVNAPEGTPNLLAYAGMTLGDDFNDNAVTGFSSTQNPAGPWAYGYKPAGGAFTLFGGASTYFGAGTNTWGLSSQNCCPMVTKNSTGSTYTYVNAPSVVQPADLLNLHPGPSGERSVVRWTAPTAGAHSISGRFQGLDTGGTTSDVLITHNGIPIFSGSVTGYGIEAPFSLAHTVAAGDIVEFTVGYGENGNYSHDSTGLAATINPVNDAPQNNAAPQVNAGLDATVNEGGTFSGTASFTDMDNTDTWSVTVDYGDGTGAQPVTPTQSKTIPLSHVYKDNGTFNVTVRVTDDAGASSTDTAVVSSINVPPTVRLNDTPSTCPADHRIEFRSIADDLGEADSKAGFMYLWTVTKNGVAYAQNAPGIGRQHDSIYDITPEEEGTYIVTLRVTDKDGGAVTISRTIIVTKIEPSDDFNDNVRDAAKWNAPTTADFTIAEQNGRLEITPGANTASYEGYRSAITVDLTEARVSVEASIPLFTSGSYIDGFNSYFMLGHSDGNNVAFRIGPTGLMMQQQVGNYPSVLAATSYNATEHRFWRFRHNLADDTINWEVSRDGVTWTVLHSAPRPFSITNLQIILTAGKRSAATQTTKATFDNLWHEPNPTASVAMVDNFDDNVINPTMWSVLDPTSPTTVTEQNGRIEVTNYTNANGLNLAGSFDFRNKSVQVEVGGNLSEPAYFRLYLDSNNYFEYVKQGGGNVYLYSYNNMPNQDYYRSHPEYSYVRWDASSMRYWRFRHDGDANTVNFDMSGDGATWTTHWTVAATFDLHSVRTMMSARVPYPSRWFGGYYVYFDNFRVDSYRHPFPQSDDFHDNMRDIEKWSVPETTDFTIVEQNGRLEITPGASVGHEGYASVVPIDLTDARAAVKVALTAPPINGFGTYLVLGDTSGNNLLFGIDGSNLLMQYYTAPTPTPIPSDVASRVLIPYDAVQHRRWRIRHNRAADSIVWETSGDSGVWTAQYTVPRPFTLTNLQTRLVAGKNAATTPTITAVFDDLQIERNEAGQVR